LSLVACVVAAPADAARPLYATVTASNKILPFSVDPASGALSRISGAVTVGQGPAAMVVSRDATHAYVAFSGASTVGVYSVGSDGSLTAAGPAVAAGTAPTALAVSPDGTRLFVANAGSSSVSRYSIGFDGSLSSLGTATTTGAQPSGLAMTPDGTRLYVANTGDDTISAYSVDPSGALTAIGSAIAADDGPTGLAVTPNGGSLYAANANAGTVSAWNIDPDGSLTSLGTAVSAGSGARSIAVSSDGTRALVANPGDGTVSRYLIGSGGALVSAGTPTTGPAGVMSVAISPSGNHAYAGGTIALSSYNLSSVTALTEMMGSPLTTNTSQNALTIAPDQGPRAKFDAVGAPATVASTFEGGASQDADGSVATWEWDFGDGSIATGHAPSHTFAQPGIYMVTLKVTDDEGCSTASSYTGQSNACVGSPFATITKTVSVGPAPVVTVPSQECSHDGNDGFCGTPDQRAPRVTVLGVTNGARINEVDAPTELVGSITPDPSGISAVKLRFQMAAGAIRGKKIVHRKICRIQRVHGKKQKTCKRKKVTIRTTTKVRACKTVSGTKNYLVLFQCSKVPWVTVPAPDGTFRYDLPAALGIGSYTLDAIAVDGAGNSDVLEQGRNALSFKIVKTPANSGTGASGTATGTTTSPPITDTGSPFG
jgi:6-phosphogluconolactonase (cycloisomerase 2 family)/PKD repeat protein